MQDKDVTFYRSPALEECFPSSEKVYNEVQCNGNTLRVPFRRIYLEGGSGHLDVPDTSGPQVCKPGAAFVIPRLLHNFLRASAL